MGSSIGRLCGVAGSLVGVICGSVAVSCLAQPPVPVPIPVEAPPIQVPVPAQIPAPPRVPLQREGVPRLNLPAPKVHIEVQGVVQNQTMQISIVNGQRQITVKRNDEQIEIHDTEGKKIRVKHTRKVNGKEVTDIYEAEDLPTLEKKHPEGAKLYKELGKQNQIQIAPAQANVIRFGGNVAGSTMGVRNIRAIVGQQRVEVSEENGKQIKVSITPREPADAPAEEFKADSLEDLRSQSAEAAELFERLAGKR